MAHDPLVIAGKEVTSRLITGSGKYRDDRIIKDVLAVAECDIITVALRRVDFERESENMLKHVPKGKSCCRTRQARGTQKKQSALHVSHGPWGAATGSRLR